MTRFVKILLRALVSLSILLELSSAFAPMARAQTNLNWVFVSATGIPRSSSTSRPLYIYLTAPGDIYVDDVSVVLGSTTNGANVITNGGFETGALPTWVIGSDSNNGNSSASTNFVHSGNYSLHLIASAGGTTKNSAIWQDASQLTVGATYTLSYWYRQTTNSNGGALIVRFSNDGIVTSNNPAAPVPPPPVETNALAITGISPAPDSTVSNLTQIQVTFSKNVTGVQAENLLIAGNPAESVSGSGSNYVFTFTQPQSGTVLVYWDTETTITDLSGNIFNASNSWTYTLVDNIAPTMISTVPAANATPGNLTQAQVVFSEPVTGVNAASLLINGVAATNATGSGIGPYTFAFPQPAQGTVQFSWSLSQNIRDANSNLFSGAGWTVTLDSAANAAALTNVVINEFLTRNTGTNGIRDEEGLLEGWIEIYNRGATSVNLAGWSLTDDVDEPAKWIFPATNILAGQYMVVFASGNDRRVAGAPLHTNFKLSPSASYLGLFNADFSPQAAFQYNYPEQRNDISYGLDDTNALRYFALTTPGGPNGFSTITGVVSPLSASVSSRFFSAPIDLVLTTATANATILYTTNGSLPTISDGVTNGIVYDAPVHIANTTAFRAAAFAENLLPTLTVSRTYLFPDDILQQPNNPTGYPIGNVWTPTTNIIQNGARAYYQMDPTIVNDPQYTNAVRIGLTNIPTMSIIMPISDLFDPTTGIYTHPQSRDDGWERACSMELIYPDGSTGAQADCGIQIQGGTQRDPAKNAKHSFRIVFKKVYGPGKLNFPLYADSPVDEYNTLVLDGGINFWWHYVGTSGGPDQRFRAQCVRDQYTSDLMEAVGNPSYHGKFFHLYLNGLYWGIHYVHERPDEDFAASYWGGDSSDYDVIKNTTFGTELLAGDLTAWNTALSLSTASLTNNSQYEQLQQYVDVDNLIDYMIVNHWIGNDDWPHHNWYVIRNRTDDSGFKFLVWDAEHVMKGVTFNCTTVTAAGSPAFIYNALRNNAEFRLRFADHLQKLFSTGGVFYTDPDNPVPDFAHPERNVPAALYMKRIAEITNAIVDESARWGGYMLTTNYTRNYHWLRELNNLLGYTNTFSNTVNYFPQRSSNILAQYKAISLFPTVKAPALNQNGGIVPAGFALTLSNQNAGGRIYFTTNGVDPRVYGSGAIASNTFIGTNLSTLILNSNVIIKARVLLNGVGWSPIVEGDFTVGSLDVPLRIVELMYNPVGGSQYEFLEIQNIGATPLDIGGFSFIGINFTFPNGTTIQPGAVMLLANNGNPSQFATRYPGVSVFGYYGGSLDNSGERIAVLDRNGQVVTEVIYNNSGGWPTAANGGGYSLELIDPYGDLSAPANWRASSAVNGSPGLPPTTPALSNIVLNEIMADNATIIQNGTNYPDWVELFNRGTNSVSLTNWSLTDSGSARKFIFPTNITIAAGDYLVIWCDSRTNLPGIHTLFGLNKAGGNIFLYDANTNRADALSYGKQATDYSLGRVNDIWQLTIPTTNAPNIAASSDSITNICINEWLVTNNTTWIELFNRSSNAPVALHGIYLATSNSLFRIGAISFLSPRKFIQLVTDSSAGSDHVDLTMPAAAGTIALYSDTAVETDRINYLQQTNGISEGRFPDGATNPTNRYFMPITTPGAANVIPNNPPTLAAISNKFVHLGQTIQFTASVSDADSWYQTFNFTLTNSPVGAFISTNGNFTWTVTNVPAPGTNSITVRVADNGTPVLSDAKTFSVIVQPPLQFNSAISTGDGNLNFTFNSVPGDSYQIEYKDNLNDTTWTPLGSPISGTGDNITLTNSIAAQPQRFYRLVVTSP